MSAPRARREHWLTALVVLAVPLLLLWPLPLVYTTHILAYPDQEAASHIWGHWAALHLGQVPTLRTTLQQYPDGIALVLVDPLNVIPFAVGWPLGVAAAYNTVLYAGLICMGTAGALLARLTGGRPWLGAVAAMACPTVVANASDGITEGFSVGVVGIFLAALLHARRTPGWRPIAGAAVALGLTPWAGPYNAVWAAFLGLTIATTTAVERDWGALRRVATIGIGGLLMGLPVGHAIFFHRDAQLPGGSDRAGLPALAETPTFTRGRLQTGSDLLEPWLPGPLTGDTDVVSHTTYLGVVVLCAALYAVYRAPRRTWPWLAGGAAFASLSLGPWLYLAGRALRIGDAPLAAPAGLLILAVPLFGRLTRWYRAGAVATILLAPVVARVGRTPTRAALLATAIVADTVLLAPLAWPLHATEPPSVDAFLSLAQDGALLELPPATAGVPPPGQWRDHSALLQVSHGHPAGGALMGLGVSQPARVGSMVMSELFRGQGLSTKKRHDLLDAGFRYLVIHRRFRVLPAVSEARVEACLGPPIALTADTRIHDLDSPAIPADGCPADTSDRPADGHSHKPTPTIDSPVPKQ